MEIMVTAGVLVFILFAIIAVGGAVYHTIRNRKRLPATVAPDVHTPPPQTGPFFFRKETQTGKTVAFHASAPSLGIEIPHGETLSCDIDEIFRYVDRLYDNTEDNFFSLEDENGYLIQFSHDGKGTDVEIDIPDVSRKGSYRGTFSNLPDVKGCIRSFFGGGAVHFDYPLTFEIW
ncbi:hypothetical protein JCM14469_15690 [Desulfatiferula olefinivorans]